MPITLTGQGFGKYSNSKQEHFQTFMKVHSKICQGIVSKSRQWAHRDYIYIDLNAGTGYYDDFDGSPITFLKTAGANHAAYFVEIDSRAAKLLDQNTRGLSKGLNKIICGNNKIALQSITKEIRELFPNGSYHIKSPFGLMYSDENGTDIPFEEMAWSLSQPHMQKIDVLIYVSCTNLKRVMKSMPEKGYKRVSEYIRLMPKKYWQVRQPMGVHQWCFLFGTNWRSYPALTKQGFHYINSEKGIEILEKISNTTEELIELQTQRTGFRQQNLFDLDLYSA